MIDQRTEPWYLALCEGIFHTSLVFGTHSSTLPAPTFYEKLTSFLNKHFSANLSVIDVRELIPHPYILRTNSNKPGGWLFLNKQKADQYFRTHELDEVGCLLISQEEEQDSHRYDEPDWRTIEERKYWNS